jgi:hypothetical protein
MHEQDDIPMPPEIREAMNLALHTVEQRQMFVRAYEGIIAGDIEGDNLDGDGLPSVAQTLLLMKCIVAFTDNPDLTQEVTDAQLNELVRQSQTRRNLSN